MLFLVSVNSGWYCVLSGQCKDVDNFEDLSGHIT